MAGPSVVTLPDSRRSEETLYLSARRETPGSRDARERATSLRDATSRGRIRPRSGAPARIDTRWMAGWSARVSFCRLRACTQQDRSKSIPSRRWECYLDRGWWLIRRRRLGFNLLTRGFDVDGSPLRKSPLRRAFRVLPRTQARGARRRERKTERERQSEIARKGERKRVGDWEKEKERRLNPGWMNKRSPCHLNAFAALAPARVSALRPFPIGSRPAGERLFSSSTRDKRTTWSSSPTLAARLRCIPLRCARSRRRSVSFSTKHVFRRG